MHYHGEGREIMFFIMFVSLKSVDYNWNRDLGFGLGLVQTLGCRQLNPWVGMSATLGLDQPSPELRSLFLISKCLHAHSVVHI